MQDFTDLIRESLDYYLTQVHTSFPGVVVEYDSETRRATIQPSLKRRAGNKEYIAFPLLIDVPVLYPGTKKYTIHIPLEKDDEVAVYFSERALEAWKDVGQDGIEDADPRRFDLCDAYCVPGLQPKEFIDVREKGLTITHKTAWDGDFISHVIIDDDKIAAKYKEKCQVELTDDKILANTEKCSLEMTGNVITLKNDLSKLTLREDKFSEKNQSQSLFSILSDFIQEVSNLVTVGPPPRHKVSPPDKLKLAKIKKRLDALMEA